MSRTRIARAIAVAASAGALVVPAAQARTITYSPRHVPDPAAGQSHPDGAPDALPLLAGLGVAAAAAGAGAIRMRVRSGRSLPIG